MWKWITVLVLAPVATGFTNGERYNLKRLPHDLKPVSTFVGRWQLESKKGNMWDFSPPDVMDFAISDVPKFGARSINITHIYMDNNNNVIRAEYGFMPVKNATRRDPRVHVAYLTTSSEGFSMIEQGLVTGNTKIALHLKQFLKRSFEVKRSGVDFEIREFERQFNLLNYNTMLMRVRAKSTVGTETFDARYKRILPI